MMLQVLPGAITRTSAQALVLQHDGTVPSVDVCPDHGAPHDARLEELLPSPRLAAHLRGLRLFRAEARGLRSGTRYTWRARSGSARCSAGLRTFDEPSAKELEVIVASCYYDGFHKDRGYLDALRTLGKNAAFKLLVGDNLYLDVHARQRSSELDGAYVESAALYLQHYVESGYRDVLAELPTYTTWDDHEFWNNFPETQKWLSRSKGRHRKRYSDAGTECLRLFQASLNPPPTGAPHLSYVIDEAPLVSFFVADVRSQRQRRRDDFKQMMPPAALEALEAWASGLKRPGVLVIGQPLCMEPGGTTDYNPPNFRAEYQRIWRAIAEAPFDILVVSGDVHHSRFVEMSLPRGRTVFEYVTSPASHIPTLQAIIGNTYGMQDRGNVHFPTKVRRTGLATAPKARYHFGTDVQNTIGHLHFRRHGDDSVEVGGSFHDLDKRCTARSTRANGGLFKRGTSSRRSPAEARVACILRPRPKPRP